MQLQFQRKSRPQQHSPQRGLAHAQNIFELHVLLHAGHDLFNLFPGKAQSLQHLPGDLRAHFFVAVEMNLARLHVARRGRRLADVVQQSGPGQRGWRARGQMLQDSDQMIVNGAFRVKFRRLLATNRRRNFRQDRLQQATLLQQLQPSRRVWRTKHFV